MEIISQEEALEKGLTFFFTGKPCKKRGHIAPQYTNGGSCLECKNINRKDFREKNPNYEIERRIKHPAEYLKRSVKYTSKQRGIFLGLSEEFMDNIKIPEFCPACGKKIKIGGGTRFDSPSIDRIINDVGYIEDNIIIVCLSCNSQKCRHDTKWFKFWYDLMAATEKKLNR